MDHAELLAVLVEVIHSGDLDSAGRRAGQVSFRPRGAAVGDPDMQLDGVAAQNAEPFVAQLGEAENALEERHGATLIGERHRRHRAQEL